MAPHILDGYRDIPHRRTLAGTGSCTSERPPHDSEHACYTVASLRRHVPRSHGRERGWPEFIRWFVIYVSALTWGVLYLTGAAISQDLLSLSAAVWATLIVGFAFGIMAGIMLFSAWLTVRSL